MRWKNPYQHDTRIVTRFAFLPVKIREEVRWLEMVKISQVYHGKWENVLFVDGEDKP